MLPLLLLLLPLPLLLLQVCYHAGSKKLITASEDGLVAIHDVAAGLNQDDGFEVSRGTGNSPASRRRWAAAQASDKGLAAGWTLCALEHVDILHLSSFLGVGRPSVAGLYA